ncbi:MAG TPA: aldo/keto reductase [Actinomycetota bacterium]|nr:aldo/keto reductase [Actinomycetota bacterium]
MELRVLGRTGVRVSSYCLGTMMLGPWGSEDPDECVRIIHAALDAGINFVDTADVYGEGESERILGRALRDRRDEVVLATKVFGQMGKGSNERGLSRLWITRALEESLKRLGTDHIDLYQVHRPDPSTDVEETLSALSDLVRQGKIRYFGSSTFHGWQLMEADTIARARGLDRFATEQPPYSIFVRHVEQDVFPVAQKLGMGILAWSPLAGGWLTGKYRRGQSEPEGSRAAWARDRGGRVGERFNLDRPGAQRKLDLVEELLQVSKEAGVPMTRLALAFSLEHPAVTSTIIGPKTMVQLEDLLGGSEVRLAPEILDRIDELVVPGSTVDDPDRGWDPPWMRPAARRRWGSTSGGR